MPLRQGFPIQGAQGTFGGTIEQYETSDRVNLDFILPTVPIYNYLPHTKQLDSFMKSNRYAYYYTESEKNNFH